MQKNQLLQKQWALFLSRPYNLFGASVWHRWYFCDYIKKTLNVSLPDALLLEEPYHMARYYMLKNQQDALYFAIQKTAQTDPEKTHAILLEGIELNQQAQQYLTRQKKFPDIQNAVDFLNRLVLHATYFPNFAFDYIPNGPTKKLAEQLRRVSFYPTFFLECVSPLAERQLFQDGVTIPNPLELITYSELLAKDFSQLPKRQILRNQNKRYVFWEDEKSEHVEFVDDPNEWIDTIEGKLEKIEIRGLPASMGTARGTVRVVFGNRFSKNRFETGDILVSPSTNPALTPLIQKSGAVVTDEGGLASHAAIICRELGKPCIVGTKNATRLLKDGNRVEVDATNGIVRKL